MERAARPTAAVGIAVAVVVLSVRPVPVAWIVSLSLKKPADLTDGKFFPRSVSLDELPVDLQNEPRSRRALINSIGIALLSTFIAIVLAAMFAAYACARLDFAGKAVMLARRAAPSPCSRRSRIDRLPVHDVAHASAFTTRGRA